MSRSLVARTSIFFAATLGLGIASAHLPTSHSTIIEFETGSVAFAATAADDLEEGRLLAIQFPREYRVLVRGYADTGTNPDPQSWKPEDLALADARARALSEAVRKNGGPACVDRVAYGYALDDWRKKGRPRVDGGTYGLAGGVVALAPLDSEEKPEAGVPIERDCGDPTSETLDPDNA